MRLADEVAVDVVGAFDTGDVASSSLERTSPFAAWRVCVDDFWVDEAPARRARSAYESGSDLEALLVVDDDPAMLEALFINKVRDQCASESAAKFNVKIRFPDKTRRGEEGGRGGR